MSELISGVDALRALADGKEVQYWSENDPSIQMRWTTMTGHFWDQYNLGYFLNEKTAFKFRLKPRTVKLEIEVPAPFQPKVGDIYFIVHPAFKSGYTCNTFDDTEKHKEFVKYGAWRTVEDIKIVVEQLRKIKELSK